jgi:hypothetical protein
MKYLGELVYWSMDLNVSLKYIFLNDRNCSTHIYITNVNE